MERQRPLVAVGILCLVLAISGATAWAGDITGIRILTATERDSGVATNRFLDVTVAGEGIANASFHDLATDQWYDLSYDSSSDAWRYRDEGFGSIEDLFTAHPNGANLVFYFNREASGAFGDAVLISYSQAYPSDYAHIIFPPPGDGHVPDVPTFEWDLAGAPQYLGMALVNENTGSLFDVVYSEDSSPRSWTPGTLESGTDYRLILGVWNVIADGPSYLSTLNGDYFTFIGIMNDTNSTTFTTNPEPATMLLMATGLVGGGWWARRRKK